MQDSHSTQGLSTKIMLFSIVDRLTKPTSAVPFKPLSNKSSYDFAAFFTEKKYYR